MIVIDSEGRQSIILLSIFYDNIVINSMSAVQHTICFLSLVHV